MANGNHRGASQAGSSVALHQQEAPDFSTVVGERLRHFMAREAISLDKLSDFLGICRDRLNRIHDGEVAPSIGLIWKIANVFGVPFGSLTSARETRGTFVLRQADAAVLSSSDGRFLSRALLPYRCKRRVEFYELKIAAAHTEDDIAHVPGTLECLVVTRGAVEIRVGKEPPQVLRKGDAFVFEADVPHSYRNLGKTEAVLYLVMSYIRLRDEIEPVQ